MAETVDELTVQFEEGGEVVVEEIDKQVLSKGAWSTVIYKYREWDRRKEAMGAEKFTIRRYQKRNGVFRQQSKFNISSVKQATGIVEALQRWIDEAE